MKSFLLTLVTGFLVFAVSTSHAQLRDLGAERILIDDGAGGTMIISYQGPGNSTFIIPPGPVTTVPVGTLAGQTLAWNGTEWEAMSNLLNTGGNLTLTGSLTGTSTGNSAGSFTVNNTLTEGTALQGVTDGTSNATGVYGSADEGIGGRFSGTIGLKIDNGALVGSTATINDGDEIPQNSTTVFINGDPDMFEYPFVIAPLSGYEGQIMVVCTDEEEGAEVFSLGAGLAYTIGDRGCITLAYINGVWRATR